MKHFNNKKLLVVFFVLTHFAITFFTDRLIFNPVTSETLFTFIFSKIILLIVLIFWYNFLFGAVISKHKKDKRCYSILKYALIYFVPMSIVLLAIWPVAFPYGDMINFFNKAVNYEFLLNLNYLTTLFHIIGMMIFPLFTGPIIFQVVVQSLMVGYVIYRFSEIYTFKYAKYLYILFFLLPVVFYCFIPNRLPLYIIFYVLFFTILYADYIEKKKASKIKIISLLALGAALSCWRQEGLYLLVFCPLFILITYERKFDIKKVVIMLLLMVALRGIVGLPQTVINPAESKTISRYKLLPVFSYTLLDMYRLGLDLDKSKSDLDTIDKVLSVEKIKFNVDDLNEKIYVDSYILWDPKYVGLRSNYSNREYANFEKSCINIIIHNPILFLESKLSAFNYVAFNNQPFPLSVYDTDYALKTYYKIDPSDYHLIGVSPAKVRKYTSDLFSGIKVTLDNGESNWLIDIFNLFKGAIYNIYIPVSLLFVFTFTSLLKRNYFMLILCLGVLAHWLMVFFTAPAAYFMYYYPVYIMGYYCLFAYILEYFYYKKHSDVK